MRTSRVIRATAAAMSGLVLVELLAAPLALAIVGAPLTPVSVAGVARRTTRRTVVVAGSAAASASATQTAAASQTAAANQAAAQSAAAASQSAAASAAAAQSAAATAQAASSKTTGPAATPAGGAALASLPEGCVAKGEVFQCGNATYKPYVQGGAIVYVPVGG